MYNQQGEQITMFYLCSNSCSPEFSGYKIFWNRYNMTLPIHFYANDCLKYTMGNPTKRYGWLIEPEDIAKEPYKFLETHKGFAKEFNAIFTHSAKMLDTLPNAKLLLLWSIWYGNEINNKIRDNVTITDNVWEKKDKNISMVCSNKQWTKMHTIRHHFANIALKSGKVDVFGAFCNRALPFKSESLETYRYQIVIENAISPYYFTEKLLDCFASMTIPIYFGATKVSEFFNSDGIICFNQDSNLEKILATCSKEDYANRLEAIRDNFKRIFTYNVEDKILEYLKEDNV